MAVTLCKLNISWLMRKEHQQRFALTVDKCWNNLTLNMTYWTLIFFFLQKASLMSQIINGGFIKYRHIGDLGFNVVRFWMVFFITKGCLHFLLPVKTTGSYDAWFPKDKERENKVFLFCWFSISNFHTRGIFRIYGYFWRLVKFKDRSKAQNVLLT